MYVGLYMVGILPFGLYIQGKWSVFSFSYRLYISKPHWPPCSTLIWLTKMVRSCYWTWYEAIAMFWGWQNLVGQVWLTGASEHMTWNWVDPGSHLWKGSRTRHPWSPCLQLLSQLWKIKPLKFWKGWLVLQDNAKELWHFHRAVLVARWPPSTPPWRHQAAAGRD